MNDTPGRVGAPIRKPIGDVHEYFQDWLAYDGFPWWSFWENVRSWWEIRHLPNVLFIHFADLKADMPAEMRRIADFLKIDIEEDKWDKMLEICSFDYMKANATKSVPLGGAFWDGGAETFINKGINGVWQAVLTEADNTLYESRARHELGEACASWLFEGGPV